MSEETTVFYTEATENTNDWTDNDDLQTLMHAAADADARDIEDAKQQSEIKEECKQISTKQEFSGYYQEKPAEQPKLKRKYEERNTTSKRIQLNDGYANVVAEHYNTLEEKGLDERYKSRIFYMRNFNNWVKSMLINEYLNKIKDNSRHNSAMKVMDMCCGKGGDLLKWRKANISHLICTDIASISLEQCQSRYDGMCSRGHREKNRIFRAEFIAADCTRIRLRERFADPSIRLELVSCQFAFHYSFESLRQAECMIQNAAECLQTGGFFIGTIPDSNEIIARQRKSNSNSFGNDIYQINFHSDTKLPPLFGAKYNFHLEGVVDCPEFLVHFPTFVKLARKFGLQLVRVERFVDFYERVRLEGSGLLQKMQCFEVFPPGNGEKLLGTAKDDYLHAEEFLERNNVTQKIGTLSKSEWEAASLYLTFAFRKVKTSWDTQGKPQYEFT